MKRIIYSLYTKLYKLIIILTILIFYNTYLFSVTDTDSNLVILATETYTLNNSRIYTNSVQINGTLYLNTKLTTPNLTISSGGVVTHTLQDSDFELEVTNNLTIEAGGSINADYKGYPGGSGPAWPHGSVYEPSDMGTGGGANEQCAGATGGGKIKITANNIINNGQITVRGQEGIKYHYWSYKYTNGAEGGSIYIIADVISGTGKITADGGDSPYYITSGGPGGRIAIYYETNNFTGDVTANGGRAAISSQSDAPVGTIYMKSTQQFNGDLILDSNSNSDSYPAVLPQGTYVFENIIIKNRAELKINNSNEIKTTDLTIINNGTLINNGSLTISNLTLESGGIFYHNEGNLTIKGTTPTNGILSIGNKGTFYLNTSLSIDTLIVSSGGVVTHTLQDSDFDLEVTNNLTIEAGGSINADYKGYPGGSGPAWPHGSVYEPSDMGTGGGANEQCAGATGGGKIKITANNIINNGQITVRGQEGIKYHYWSYKYTNGAEGGSIYIIADVISGTGKITADGGDSPYYITSGGPGGRIAIYYETNNFTGDVTANGGRAAISSQSDAPVGTIIYKSLIEDSPLAVSNLNEIYKKDNTVYETLKSQNLILQNNTFESDTIIGTLVFNNFNKVEIKTGAFSDKGFFKSEFNINIGNSVYLNQCNGMSYLNIKERKIYLYGNIKGPIYGIMEGVIQESIVNSNNYDIYFATLSIIQAENQQIVERIKISGSITYQTEISYPNTQLYYLQKMVEGKSIGYYTGNLTTTLTLLRITETSNPYNNEGFSIMSFNSDLGAGMIYATARHIHPQTKIEGVITKPIYGLASADIDENTKNMSLNITRLDYGQPPQPDLSVKIFGSNWGSPGQLLSHTVEVRNDGFGMAENYAVLVQLSSQFNYLSSSVGCYHQVLGLEDWGNEQEPFSLLRWDMNKIPAKSVIKFNYQAILNWRIPENSKLKCSAELYKTQEE